ncbi:protease SohB [Psychrosphaera haliotis]|uniref:protease SohB n=1 Tax=Psychrosphaera haliotis TaxID=555083 RepID=UPI0031DE43FC
MEFLYEYGLFIAKTATIVVAIGLVLGFIAGAAIKPKNSKKGELNIEYLSEEYQEDVKDLKKALLSKEQIKAFDKKQKAEDKSKKKENKKKSKSSTEDLEKSRLFVLEFDGDVEASATESLREEITAIVSIAEEGDRVVLNLESPGGVVHGYGLASSQIARLKSKNIHTTVAVDKVAASGGYMMACVADEIVAAPFAIIGSIGVVAQLPNINKLLKKYDVEIEQHTAGEFKRTLTVLGENTDTARTKFKEELEETHVLFKEFVADNRPSVDIDKVATGEHWYGSQALTLNLVDRVMTSDDLLLEAVDKYDVYKIEYKVKHNIAERFGFAASTAITKLVGKLSTWSVTNTK